ncbi:hypothetical protein JVU11DRAFT_2496 [Chiua virens]|nr:hypothetical protein JVU11DRAFT_2496 [Chiua virens]
MTSSQHPPKDAHRVAAGLKAAINNPNVSDEAKVQAREKLREMGEDVPAHPHEARHRHGSGSAEVEESTHVLGGYKATLSNPYTSPEAKQHAEEVLQAAGILERDPDHTDEQHQVRVIAGYKAALHSMSLVFLFAVADRFSPADPRVSEEGKKHAREYLKEHGVKF